MRSRFLLDKRVFHQYDKRQLFTPVMETSNKPHAAREIVPEAGSTFP